MIHSESDYILEQLPILYDKTKLIQKIDGRGQIAIDQLFRIYVDLLLIPFLEFTDNLMESIMYPEGFLTSPAKLIRDHLRLDVKHMKISTPTTTLSLGHPIILQVISLKNELKTVSNANFKGDKSKIIHLFIRSKEILKQIFQLLARDKIVPSREVIDTQILDRFTPYMTELSKLFELIYPVFKSVIDTQKKSKLEEASSEIFVNMDKIVSISKDLYINIIKESSTLKDFLVWRQDLSCKIDNKKNLDDNTEFSTFVHHRKTLLNLNNRRIF